MYRYINPLISGWMFSGPSRIQIKPSSAVTVTDPLASSIPVLESTVSNMNSETMGEQKVAPSEEYMVGIAPKSYMDDSVDTDVLVMMWLKGTPRARVVEKMHTSSTAAYRALGVRLERELEAVVSSATFVPDGAFYGLLQEYMHIVGALASRPTTTDETPFDLSATRARELICPFVETDEFRSIVRDTLDQSIRRRHSLEYRNVKPDSDSSFLLTPIAYLSHICPVKADMLLRYGMLNDRLRAWVHEHSHSSPWEETDRIELKQFSNLDTMLELLVAVSPKVIINKLAILYSGPLETPADPLRDFFSKMIVSVFCPLTEDDRSFFLFIPTGERSIYRINPTYGSLPGFRVYYMGVGRLLAISLLDALPLGLRLNYGLMKLLIAGSSSQTVSHVWTMDDLREDDPDSYVQLSERIESILAGTVTDQKFVSLDGKRRGIMKDGNRVEVTAANVHDWAQTVVNDCMYRRSRHGYKAIIEGFYSVMQQDILRFAVTSTELADIFEGRRLDMGEAILFDAGIDEGNRALIRQVVATAPQAFCTATTGMLALPLLMSIGVGLNNAPRPASGQGILHTLGPLAETNDLLRERLERILLNAGGNSPRLELYVMSYRSKRAVEPPIDSLISSERVQLADLKRWKTANPTGDQGLTLFATNIGNFQSASLNAFKYMGGLQLIELILRDFHTQTVTAELFQRTQSVLMLVGEFASRPRNLNEEEVFDLSRIPLQLVCSILQMDYFIDYIRFVVSKIILERESHFYNIGLRNPLLKNTDPLVGFPFADIPKVCDIPVNTDLKKAIMFNRIGRHLFSVAPPEHTRFANSPILFDFDLHDMLTNILITPVERLQRKLEIRYSDNMSMGPGVYRDWFHRLWNKILQDSTDLGGLFVFDDSESTGGVFRINPLLGSNHVLAPLYQAVGRLFALSILDTMPIGQRFNAGLFWMLINIEQLDADQDIEVNNSDLQADSVEIRLSIENIVKSQQESEVSLFSYVSIDEANTPLGDGDNEIELSKDNVVKWAQRAARHHMFGQHRIANTAIATGFYEILPVGLFRDTWISSEELRAIVQGHMDVTAEALLASVRFIGYPDNQLGLVTEQLQYVLAHADSDFRKQFLYFATGLFAIPQGGLGEISSIKISFVVGHDRVPVAHTCFNRIDMPVYPNDEIMRAKLGIAFENIQMSLV